MDVVLGLVTSETLGFGVFTIYLIIGIKLQSGCGLDIVFCGLLFRIIELTEESVCLGASAPIRACVTHKGMQWANTTESIRPMSYFCS